MIDVVAAVFRDGENRVLIAQRNIKKDHGGFWEFPGGKVEEKETRKQAIVREIKEELDLDISADRIFCQIPFHYPDGKEINLIGIECTILSGNLKLLEHEDAQWVKIEELNKWKLTLPDVNISVILREGLKSKDGKPEYARITKGKFEDVPSFLTMNEVIMY